MDFAEGFYCNRKRQVGKCGISDRQRVFHALVYGIFNSENADDATTLLSTTLMLLKEIAHVGSTRTLTDGSKALKNAVKSLNMIEKDCFSHIGRPLGSRGSGKRGAHASLARYLLTHGVSLAIINHMLHIFLGLRHLSTEKDWLSARMLFLNFFPFLFNPEFNHFRDFYLPEKPRWGAASHLPGEVQSTNGLEVDWKPIKSNCTNEKKSSVNKNDFLINTFNAISNR